MAAIIWWWMKAKQVNPAGCKKQHTHLHSPPRMRVSPYAYGFAFRAAYGWISIPAGASR
jgi:hypothetical protein